MHLPWRDVAPGDGPAISTSLTQDEAAELRRLAKGRHVLEIGSAFGYSAIVMALAGARHVTAVDPHEAMGSEPQMRANLDAYGVAPKVTIWRGRSCDVLPSLPSRSFGLVFIDGDHTAEVVRQDATVSLGLLRKGGVLAAQDYGEDCCCPGVRQGLDAVFPDGPTRQVDTLFVVET